jgi:hypothetical protein
MMAGKSTLTFSAFERPRWKMVTLLLSFLLLAQDLDQVVRELGSDDPGRRRDAEQTLLRLGRDVYPALRRALDSNDTDLRERARGVAFSLGMDPDTHLAWEILWARYGKTPDPTTRQRLELLGTKIPEPRLTLLVKIDGGLFEGLPMCGPFQQPGPRPPSAAEWEVLDEVTRAVQAEGSAYSKTKLPDVDALRWGIHLLRHGAPRAEVVAAWRAELRLHPKSGFSVNLLRGIGQLEQMAREESSARPPMAEAPRDPLREAQDWALRLRDESDFNRDDLCFCPDLRKDLPSDHLVALGKSAVPALLERVADRSLTRSATVAFSSHSSYLDLVTVGSAAIQTLHRITGFYVTDLATPQRYPGLGEEERYARAFQEWWAREKDREPAQWCRDWIAQEGDHRRAQAAKRLFKLEGRASIPCLLEALARTSGGDQGEILDLLAELSDDLIRPALQRLLQRPVDPWILPPLASALAKQGDFAGMDALKGHLREHWGKDEGWMVTGRGFGILGESSRFEDLTFLLEAASGSGQTPGFRLAALGGLVHLPKEERPAKAALAMLSTLLGDDRETSEYYPTTLRFCDLAACRLAGFFPDEVSFILDLPEKLRNAQIERIQEWARRKLSRH